MMNQPDTQFTVTGRVSRPNVIHTFGDIYDDGKVHFGDIHIGQGLDIDLSRLDKLVAERCADKPGLVFDHRLGDFCHLQPGFVPSLSAKDVSKWLGRKKQRANVQHGPVQVGKNGKTRRW